MTKRRVDINVKAPGWLGWLLLGLVAIPLAVLSFFFFAAMLFLVAAMVLVAVVRFYWLRYKMRMHEPATAWRRDGASDTITIEARAVRPDTGEPDSASATPLRPLPPS